MIFCILVLYLVYRIFFVLFTQDKSYINNHEVCLNLNFEGTCTTNHDNLFF